MKNIGMLTMVAHEAAFQSGGKDVVVDVYNDCPVDSLSLELKRIGAKASTEQSRFLKLTAPTNGKNLKRWGESAQRTHTTRR